MSDLYFSQTTLGELTMDMRRFLEEMRNEAIIVDDEVDWNLEATNLLWKLENQKKYPITIFRKIRNLKGNISKYPLVTNIFASRERCARIFNTTMENLSKRYAELEDNQLDPVYVRPNEAPVKKVTIKDKDVDLREFPILRHHEKDAGPYITAGVHILKHPKYGYNAAILRNQYKEPNKLGVFMVPGRHSDVYVSDYEKREEDIPVAIVIGHHPRFYFGAQTKKGINEDEYRIIGGVMESPLRVTKSETLGDDFLIPADAEIVLEGKIPANIEEEEGGFGEYPKYYGSKTKSHVVEITAINMRKDPFYIGIFPGHNDHFILGGIPIEAHVYKTVKSLFPNVNNVHLPVSGGCRSNCYVQIRKLNKFDAKNVILATLSAYPKVKHVIVVDEDIDIFNDSHVMWAIATRVQMSRDVIIIPNCPKAGLDPTARNGASDRGGVDATQPLRLKLETLKPPKLEKRLSEYNLRNLEKLEELFKKQT